MSVEISKTKMGHRISVISISNKVIGTANNTTVVFVSYPLKLKKKKKLNLTRG